MSQNNSLEIDLSAAIEKVRGEFEVLVRRILPLLLRWEQEQGGTATSQDDPFSLTTWQRVARDLGAALPTTDGRPGIPIDEGSLEGFLHHPAKAGFQLGRRGIAWRLENYTPLELEDIDARSVLEIMHGEPIAEEGARDRFFSQFEEFKDWFIGPGLDHIFVINAMCWILPRFVDLDLQFVRSAFDLDNRMARIQSDASVGEAEQKQRLQVWSSPIIMHGFNNALLHVIAALANNQFDQIESFLDHPAREGFYTWLMPHYLVAILHQKVRILNELLREDSERAGANGLIRASIGCPS